MLEAMKEFSKLTLSKHILQEELEKTQDKLMRLTKESIKYTDLKEMFDIYDDAIFVKDDCKQVLIDMLKDK